MWLKYESEASFPDCQHAVGIILKGTFEEIQKIWFFGMESYIIIHYSLLFKFSLENVILPGKMKKESLLWKEF